MKNQSFQQRLEWASLIGLITLWMLSIIYYNQLPAELPTHFGTGGKPGNWQAKHHLFWLPLLGLLFHVGLGWLRRRPALPFNHWTTAKNERQVALGREMLSVLQVLITGSFLYLTWASIQTGLGNQSGLGGWFPIVFWTTLVAVMGYYLVSHLAADKQK